MLDCNPAPDGFDARHDAISRTYCYRVLHRRARSVWWDGRALWHGWDLDLAALHACAAALPGTHDFTAFTPTDTYHTRFERLVAVRRVADRDGDLLEFWITADTFMRSMNRILVGTMLEVATGRRTLEDFAALLDGRAALGRRPDRGAARPGAGERRLPTGPLTILEPRHAGPADQRRRDRGRRACRRCAAPCCSVPGIELVVIAPDGNRSAMARSITTMRPLWVEEIAFDDGTTGYATDGTPVDCVRLANLGLVEGFEAELIVSGINHGANLGDDITYSGTVAAALEGVILGLPAIAVSQQSSAREMDFRLSDQLRLRRGRALRRPRRRGDRRRAAAAGHAAERQLPRRRRDRRAGHAAGQADLPRRADAERPRGRRDGRAGSARAASATGSTAATTASTTSRAPTSCAVAAGDIAVTPLHFDLTDAAGMDALERHDLGRLLAPAAEEVE